MKRILGFFLAIFMMPAAHADEPYAITPSGQTEAIFDLGVTETSDRIANGCIDVGWTVVSSTSTMVVCEGQLGTMESVLSQLLIGNSYSTPPRQFVRFNLAGLSRSTRVQATGWVETQMAFGQVRKEDMQSAHYHNNVMSLFAALDARYPPGTSFPYHAYLGANFVAREKPRGLEITEIKAGSPAEEAGLRVGDVLTRIARERTKGYDDILDALHRASKRPTYEVELSRDHTEMKVTVALAYREPVSEPEFVDLPPEPEQEQQAGTINAIVPLSPAEELAKFADLRDQGIISEAEFESQKARLLGGAVPTLTAQVQQQPQESTVVKDEEKKPRRRGAIRCETC